MLPGTDVDILTGLVLGGILENASWSNVFIWQRSPATVMNFHNTFFNQ